MVAHLQIIPPAGQCAEIIREDQIMTIVHDAPKPRRGRPPRAEASAKALARVDWSQFDPVEVLRRIAADTSAPASARVAACRALIAAEAAPGDGEDAAPDSISRRALQIMAAKGFTQ